MSSGALRCWLSGQISCAEATYQEQLWIAALTEIALRHSALALQVIPVTIVSMARAFSNSVGTMAGVTLWALEGSVSVNQVTF